MTDDRQLRDGLEATQSELRAARALLATPLDVPRLNLEIGEQLAALAREKAQLLGELDGLREAVEQARLWSLAKKLEQPPGALKGSLQLLAVLGLGSVYVLCGVKFGGWLARERVPWQAAVPASLLLCGWLFTEVSQLGRALWRRPKQGPTPTRW